MLPREGFAYLLCYRLGTLIFGILVPTWPQLASQLGAKTWTDENGKQLLDIICRGMLETYSELLLLVAGWIEAVGWFFFIWSLLSMPRVSSLWGRSFSFFWGCLSTL